MQAEIVRLTANEVDIKVLNGAKMHILQWRRRFFYDEVLLDGRSQAVSRGFTGRENVYGLVFGRDDEGRGGDQIMFIIDPIADAAHWFSSHQKLSGIRLEMAKGPILAYGSLDPKSLEKPTNFSDWMKKTLGMEW